MSDDPPPSSAARVDDPAGTDGAGAASLETPEQTPEQTAEGSAAARARSSSRSRRRRKKKSRKKRSPGLAKKLEFVTHLLKSLDTLVFAELSALYYMECSMFRFIIRAAGHYMYLTPKDESFPFLMPASRIHVLLIVLPNILCMLLHTFASLPTGPDFHRGYLHGGMVIDFIGQRPPTWRVYYLLADVAIFVLQCLMLTVHTEREKLRVSLKTFRPLLPELAQELTQAAAADDLDAEERGVSREEAGLGADETNDIELRSMEGQGERQANDGPDEPESLTRVSSGDDSQRSHLSDMLSSGNAVLGEYHVIQAIRVASTDLERTTASSLQSLSYGATMAALEARRRSRTAQGQAMRATR